MKKIFFSVIFALIAICANAQDVIKAENIEVKAGETATVAIALENETDFCGFSLEVTLPEGITFAPVYDEDEEDYVCGTLVADRVNKNHELSFSYPDKQNEQCGQFMCFNPKKNTNFKGNEGTLFTFPIKAAASLAAGQYKVTVDNIMFTENVEGQTVTVPHVLDAITFTVTVNDGTTTAISNVAVENAGVAFNLAGQKVNKNFKGVVIENGKKIVRK